MIEYTQHNSMAFEYGGVPFAMKSPGDSLTFTLGACSREPGTFAEECYQIARIASDKAASQNRAPTILLSGGLDSEVVCKSFIDQGLPFDVVTFRFDNNKNYHELHFVHRFAARHNLKPRYYDIDAVKYLETPEAKALYLRTDSARTIMLPHMLLMSDVWNSGGMPITGGGDIALKNDNGWKFCKYEYMLPWYRYSAQEEIDGVVAYFQHTPEIVLAMLREKEITRLFDPQNKSAKILCDARLEKYRVYHRYWPDFEKRPKYSGIELLFDLYWGRQIVWNNERPIPYDEIWQVDIQTAINLLSPVNDEANNQL